MRLTLIYSASQWPGPDSLVTCPTCQTFQASLPLSYIRILPSILRHSDMKLSLYWNEMYGAEWQNNWWTINWKGLEWLVAYLDAPPRHIVLRPLEIIITPRRDSRYLGALSKRASPEYTSQFVRLKQSDRLSNVVKWTVRMPVRVSIVLTHVYRYDVFLPSLPPCAQYLLCLPTFFQPHWY